MWRVAPYAARRSLVGREGGEEARIRAHRLLNSRHLMAVTMSMLRRELPKLWCEAVRRRGINVRRPEPVACGVVRWEGALVLHEDVVQPACVEERE